MRRPVTLLVALGALFAAVPAASASTLSQDGSGVLTYQAAATIDNDIYLDQDDTTASTLTIDTANDPVTGTLPANCTDPADPDTGETIVCTGVSRIVLNTLDGEDYIEAWDEVESLPMTADLGADDDDIESGNGDDTITGGEGDDELYGDFSGCPGCAGAGGNDTLDGGPGDDWVAGGLGNDTVNGGDGNDGAVGGAGDDTISAGAGDDNYVGGGAGNDTVNGDAGADYVFGDCEGPCNQDRPGGNDTVNGGDGDDYLAGDDGNDTINGDAGEDTLATDNSWFPFDADKGAQRDPGDDNWNGGSGIDRIEYNAYGYDSSTGDDYAIDVRITHDGQANDGQVGENDNVNADIEDVEIDWTCCTPEGNSISGVATILMGGGINGVYGGAAGDSLDGGAGNDFVFAYSGNDTVNARDGFADRIDCGETYNQFTGEQLADADVANVDQFDSVASNCETVNVAQVGNANEDAPPTIAFASPAAGTKLSTKTATALTVTTSADTTQVVFLDDDRIVCTDTTAPFTCDYKPRGEDVGRNTLVAVAYDALQQTATAVRTVVVPRFAPKVTAKTTPKRDAESPFTFTTKGRVVRPAGVSAALGCKGKVTIQIKAGKKTVSTRRANVKKNCSFSKKVTFTVPARLNPSKLNVFVRFGGNSVLSAKSRKKYSVRAK